MLRKRCSHCGSKMSKGVCKVCQGDNIKNLDDNNTMYHYEMIDLEEDLEVDDQEIEEELEAYEHKEACEQKQVKQTETVQVQDENLVKNEEEQIGNQELDKDLKDEELEDEELEDEDLEDDDTDIHFQYIDYTEPSEEIPAQTQKPKTGLKILLFILLFILLLVIAGSVGYAAVQYGLVDMLLSYLPR